VGEEGLLSSKLTSWLWHAGLVALGILVGCGGSASRTEPDGSPQGATGGTEESNRAPTGGEKTSTGGVAVPTRGGGPSEGGAPAEGGALDSGGIAGSAGAGSGGAATSMSGGGGGVGSVSSGGMATAGSGGGGGGTGPVHDRCADPLQIDFVNGEATVSDDTSRATDEFPSLTCGGLPEQGFQGGQIYYRFTARPGREYALRLKEASFAAIEFYVFPAGDPCDVEAIRSACSSKGVTGTRSVITPTTLTPFAPREPGEYIIGVDRSLTKGAPFTLSVLEYCGTSGGTDCKVKGCDLNLGKTCLGNTASACNDDGTATVTTDCATTGKSCQRGFCVASIFDRIGNTWPTSPAMTAGAGGVTLLDFYEVTTSRTLTQLEMLMVQPRSFTLDWRIFESTDRAGPYQPIFTTRTMSAGAMETSSETTGPIQVPILAGRFYAIGVALPAGARYYLHQQAEENLKSLPLDVSFGWVTSATVVQSASSSAAIGYPAPDAFLIAQEITTKL